ncbi:hypothetical protein FQN54_000224 [Arachnomyces sp. PD_36]|nr:hypothetical protein FQN54_000224 [Arachnomyces sp. PD_36]
MSRQYTLFPKLQIPSGSSAPVAALESMTSSSNPQPQHAREANPRNHIFRAKRKHVLKACDRCRVKKTKCDGDQPCNRSNSGVSSFVEMLESHHALVVKALQQLYKHCINNEGFPGEPLDTVDGYPLTHAILDRLGLIKLGESTTNRVGEETTAESLDYWRHMSMSTDSNGIDEPSPEPISPSEPAPPSFRTTSLFSPTAAVKCEQSAVSPTGQYCAFPASQSPGAFQATQSAANPTDFAHPQINGGFSAQEGMSSVGMSRQHIDAVVSPVAKNNAQCAPISPWCVPRDSAIYSDIEGFSSNLPDGALEPGSEYQQHYTLDSSPCYVWPYSPM